MVNGPSLPKVSTNPAASTARTNVLKSSFPDATSTSDPNREVGSIVNNPSLGDGTGTVPPPSLGDGASSVGHPSGCFVQHASLFMNNSNPSVNAFSGMVAKYVHLES